MADLIPVSPPFDPTILAGQVGHALLAMYERDFRAYLAFAGSPEAALEAATLARWRTHLAKATTMSPNTINCMLSAVKRMMAAAAEQQFIEASRAEAFRLVRGVKLGALKERLACAQSHAD